MKKMRKTAAVVLGATLLCSTLLSSFSTFAASSGDGNYIHSTFESATDSWTTRGDDSVSVSQKFAYCGNSSLFVSGRSSSWNGVARVLSASTFVPGSSYSFSVYAMHKGSSSETFKLTLQYTDSANETNYAGIAEATAVSGSWVHLSNLDYTIPADAKDMLIYVETIDTTTSFYVDEFQAGASGTDFTTVTDIKKLGDSNGDGSVTLADVVALQQYLIGRLKTVVTNNSDLNGDNVLDGMDLAELKRLVLFPVAEPDEPDEPDEPEEVVPADTWRNLADISWIDTSKPMVAICFDDGPVGTASSDTSIRIQNALADNGFHATFFYWGVTLNNNTKGEIARAYELGFEVANHTKSHPYLTQKSTTEMMSEVYDQANALKEITGQEHYLIRPPYLATNQTVLSTIQEPFITCNIDSQDWNGSSASQIVSKVQNAANDGSLANSIVLMHETYTSTAEAMETLCPYLKQKGYQIVTVSELFKANGKQMKNGVVYSSAK